MWMRVRLGCAVAPVTLLGVLVAAGPAAAAPEQRCPAPAPLDLGTLPGDVNSEAAGVNNHGEVVGSSRTPPTGPGTSISRPVIWTGGGVLGLGSLGGTAGGATAINEAGVAVGWSWTASQDTHAFSWSR